MRNKLTAFLILALAATCLADSDPLGDLAAKLRDIQSQDDLTTAARIEKIQKLKPITVKAKGTVTDVVPTTVWIDVPLYRQDSRGRWIPSGTDHREIPALRIDVTGDNLAIPDGKELVGKSTRWFNVSSDKERKTAATWSKGDDVSWTEKVSVTDQGRLKVDPVYDRLADLTRTPKPEPAPAAPAASSTTVR